MNIIDLTALEVGNKIRKREVSVQEVLEAYLSMIEKKEETLNSFITVAKDEAYMQAKEVQKKLDKGDLFGPLAGVPFALKDNICTKQIRTTCGSKMLADFVPGYHGEVVRRLENAGAIMIGKTNMDEFAMGSTTETSFFGVTRNPVAAAHVPGGSSGGSCAAVAAQECAYALGTDTGGSIRQPSAYCGVTGLKPTYGTVSRYGLIAYGSSLDQIGPIARDVSDCAVILETITGCDRKDATSVKQRKKSYRDALVQDVKGMRIGLPKEYFGEGLDKEVRETVLNAATLLQREGAVVEECELGLIKYGVPTYYIIACAEASSNLERFDGVRYGHRTSMYDNLQGMYKKSRAEGFGEEVKRRIILGTFVLSAKHYEAYYQKALKVKRLIKEGFNRAFASYDLLLSPVTPTTAPYLGESLKDPLSMYLGDIYTITANLAGLPGISVPAGYDSNGLPIGVQLLSDCFGEDLLIRAAFTFEQIRGGLVNE